MPVQSVVLEIDIATVATRNIEVPRNAGTDSTTLHTSGSAPLRQRNALVFVGATYRNKTQLHDMSSCLFLVIGEGQATSLSLDEIFIKTI